MSSAAAPLATWLHLGPNSQATVCVTFVGTHKSFTLDRVQAHRLRNALDDACARMDRDDGEALRQIAYRLDQGAEG